LEQRIATDNAIQQAIDAAVAEAVGPLVHAIQDASDDLNARGSMVYQDTRTSLEAVLALAKERGWLK
jgi:hypothetical protein